MECYICDKTEPGYFNRCDKHNVCLSCGKHKSQLPQPHWCTRGGFRCGKCEEKRIKDKIEKFQEENPDAHFDYEDEIICPHCGEKHSQDGEGEVFYRDGDHDFTCGDCGNEFEVTTYIEFSYSSYKKIIERDK